MPDRRHALVGHDPFGQPEPLDQLARERDLHLGRGRRVGQQRMNDRRDLLAGQPIEQKPCDAVAVR
ncbi:hypothetical protein [Pinisolibacter aquiterrae]|uniref:hypothetical protein n=1 Tax=Pinisolibacter aquiterrae TaxID=2815579 RepID=UPI001E605611|nr:hypothetical protein [Pinisolibacter aquiterrae]MCC8235798.1 hypothetical protein [Pinisolibacter aquiterrae]